MVNVMSYMLVKSDPNRREFVGSQDQDGGLELQIKELRDELDYYDFRSFLQFIVTIAVITTAWATLFFK